MVVAIPGLASSCVVARVRVGSSGARGLGAVSAPDRAPCLGDSRSAGRGRYRGAWTGAPGIEFERCEAYGTVRLVHELAGFGDCRRRVGALVEDFVQRVAERAPAVVELGVLRAREPSGCLIGEALDDRRVDGDAGRRRHVAGVARHDLLARRGDKLQRKCHREVGVRAVGVDVPAVSAGQRVRDPPVGPAGIGATAASRRAPCVKSAVCHGPSMIALMAPVWKSCLRALPSV